MPRPRAGRPRLTVEPLESRVTPATGLWSSETFDPPRTQLPGDWDQWPGSVAGMSSGAGLGSSGALVLPSGASVARAWEESILPPDYGVRASLRWEGSASAQLFVRGSAMATAQPSFLAAALGSGGTVQIVRVLAGKATVLSAVRADPWPGGQWLQVTLLPQGDRLAAIVHRPATGEYLNPAGRWQSGPTYALTATDGIIRGAGSAGVNRPGGATGQVRVDDFGVIAPDLPGPAPADLPAPAWSRWGSDGEAGFRPVAGAIASEGGSRRSGRAWLTAALPSDVSASTSVLADSLIPASLIVRGRDLNSDRPTYYAATVVRGAEVKLVRVVGGVPAELGSLKTTEYLTGVWLEVSATAQGDRLQVRVRRQDTGTWLNRFGGWQSDPAAALDARDDRIAGPGLVGISRAASVAGTVLFRGFTVSPAVGDLIAPRVALRVLPLDGRPATGAVRDEVRLEARVEDAGGIGRVELFVDGALVRRLTAAPYRHDFQTRDLPNGSHTVVVRAWDAAGNLAEDRTVIRVANASVVARPHVPRHYAHIRVAALAYNGNPMGAGELTRLRDSIDLVVPNARFLNTINTAAPGTPQLVYSNLSNLYLELLTDWLNFADRHGLAREAAFYHVSRATAFIGDSPSSQPVSWFWNVATGPGVGTGGFTGRTSEARGKKPGGVPFGGSGSLVYIGYPERFGELNLTAARTGSSRWSGVLEYPTRVDAAGRPVAWAPVRPGTDSTNGLRGTGRVTFDPPSDWKPAVVPGSATRLYYVRIRSTAGAATDGPAATILGRDYVNARGGPSGVIPAFDTAADRDRDGYLTGAEYAARRPGFDARFAYESRLFYPHYGQMRFVTNPSGDGVADWAADYQRRYLAANPLADGLFMDNSGGRAPTDGAALVESTDTYASDYGAMLGAVNRAIAPKWVLANTSGGGTDADRVVRRVPGTIEEFALRPLAHTWVQFHDLAATVARRLALNDPAGYLVLDSLSTGGSPTDPRTRMAALAEYYLLSDPESTFFMAWGGEEPASAWSRHWWDAIAFNVGKPKGQLTEFASGTDHSNPALTYRLFQRAFDNALILYKPLSYATGQGTGSTGDGTATTHMLDRNYRLLRADGTLGPVTRTVTLRNGEGAILVRA